MQQITSLSKQRGAGGIAIIFALMVVAIVSAIAVQQSWRSDLDLTRAGHRWMGIQAKAYAEGAEALAIIALNKDLENSPKLDALTEDWAVGFEFPTDHGSMQVRIIDAQSRLNLNALERKFKTPPAPGSGNQVQGHPKYHAEHLRFIRLLQLIPLDDEGTVLGETDAEAILEAVKDWIDRDSDVEGFGGAEQNYYDQQDPPITISNGPMVSVTELRLIKGMTPLLYDRLLPYVAALDDTGAALNVNTASPQVLRTLGDDQSLRPLDEEQGTMLFNEITEAAPEEHNDFQGMPQLSNIFPQGQNNTLNVDLTGVDYKTGWFELHTTVTVGDHVRRSLSLIDRRNLGDVKVVKRSDSRF